MRYYSVKLTNPDTGALIVPRSLAGLNTGSSYTSTSNGLSSGTPLLGAMNINIDIPVAPYAEPAGQGWVQLEGPALAEISQANNLNGAGIEVYGGFTAGLPLENPKQAGLLVKGTVFPAFGNWIDVEQTLDLIIVPPLGSDSNPVNITGTWQKGTQLAGVLAIVLTNAFPGLADPVINISPNLVATEDQPWAYNNLQQFAEYLKETTAALINSPNYRGVDISLKGNQIVVSDGTVSTTPKPILFQELIGQPTWLDPSTLQFKCPMRADLSIADFITMPPALVTSSAGAVSPLVNANATFKGTFELINVRHVGDFRSDQADAWVTVFDAATTPVSTTG